MIDTFFRRALKTWAGAMLIFVTLFTSSFAALPAYVHAAYNPQINYQGKLVGSTGSAVSNGTYAMEFKLYTVASGGVAIWTETRTGGDEVTVTDGLFSVMLGEVATLAGVDFNQTLYLGVKIESDAEMTPRKKLGAVPAAFVSENTNTLDSLDSTQFLRSDAQNVASSSSTFVNVQQNGSGKIAEFFMAGSSSAFVIANNGNVGIGSSTPGYLLSVAGASRFTGASIFDGTVDVAGAMALSSSLNVTGQTTIASASSTNLTVSGQTFLSNASTTNLTVTGRTILANASSTSFTVSGATYLGSSVQLGTDTITDFTGTGLSIVSGALTVSTSSLGLANSFFVQNGNSFGATAVLGTNDAQSLQFETNGSAKVTILSGGNVGVGTSTPGSLLTMSASSNPTFTINTDSTNDTSKISFQTGASELGAISFNQFVGFRFDARGSTRFIIDDLGNVAVGTSTTSSSLFSVAGGATIGVVYNASTAPTNGLLVQGNVGVGSSSPAAKLTVKGSGTTTGVNFQLTDSADVRLLTVLDNGNVGIGTTSPTSKLSVVGDLFVRSTGTNNNYIQFLSNDGTGNNMYIGGGSGALNITAPNASGPSVSLTYSSASNANALSILQSNSGGNGATSSALFKIMNSGSNPYFSFDNRLVLTSSGNVGIGSTTPGYLLSVA
ncbi:MAG TPA: hypothetical protein PLF31_01390, partial [Candidatus Paceibacterota bacterium]|nr:hypothetical protein [Candidatus Paceibacterota bacterium]